jgi:hypothetical protein
LSQKVKEDLRIVGLFQYVANYTKKMEHTRIELLEIKLLRDRNEAKKRKLEGKVIVAQQEAQHLQI